MKDTALLEEASALLRTAVDLCSDAVDQACAENMHLAHGAQVLVAKAKEIIDRLLVEATRKAAA